MVTENEALGLLIMVWAVAIGLVPFLMFVGRAIKHIDKWNEKQR